MNEDDLIETSEEETTEKELQSTSPPQPPPQPQPPQPDSKSSSAPPPPQSRMNEESLHRSCCENCFEACWNCGCLQWVFVCCFGVCCCGFCTNKQMPIL